MKSSDIDQDLFTDSYCKVCSAQLISESQRVAHYEVRTAFPTQCFHMEERVAWVVVVGLEGSPFCSWGDFKNHRACTFVVWAQARSNVGVWRWEGGLGKSFSAPGCFPDVFFSLYLGPSTLSGFSLLVKSVIAHPWSSLQEHKAGCIGASFSFLHWPWNKLEALCSSLQGNMATSWLSTKLLPPGGCCPKCAYQLKDFPCRVITKF